MPEETEQLIVQLAGCSVAALGDTNKPAVKGDYGWSPAYQDVLNLRCVFDKVVNKESFCGAVARGWTHTKNRLKEMDVDLAEAIVDKLLKLPGKAYIDTLEEKGIFVSECVRLGVLKTGQERKKGETQNA